MKTVINQIAIMLLTAASICGQVKFEVVTNASSASDVSYKAPALSLQRNANLQPNLVTKGLNDVNMSFRVRQASDKKYVVQVFEHINYTGLNDVMALPVYLSNANYWGNVISSFKFLEMKQTTYYYGGGGGSHFDGARPFLPAQIKTINIWSDQFVNAIQLIWTNHGSTIPGAKIGGGGGHLTSITLLPGEVITTAGGRAGEYVDYLYFRTNMGRVISAGGNGGSEIPQVHFGNNGGYFNGIVGRAGDLIDAISFLGYSDKIGSRIVSF